MNVLVIHCHPVETSFSAALHRAVLDRLRASRQEVTDLDLYAEGFDPVLSRQERLEYLNPARNAADVRKYAEQLSRADAIVLVYPGWWYGLPALLKGYFDRVWLPGVAFDIAPDGRVLTDRLNRIRRIIVVTTYGSPWWLIRLYMGDPARKVLSRGMRRLCGRGCRMTWHVKYNMDRATPPQLSRFLDRVRAGISTL